MKHLSNHSLRMRQLVFFLFLTFFLQAGYANGTHYMESDFFKSMQPGDKAALVMVHFGTTHDDTREKTIHAINRKAQEAFPDMDHYEAYTSRIVIRLLKQRGVEKQTPSEVLKQLKKAGYTHVILQSSNIIDGIEMESLHRDVQEMEEAFKDIRIGKPLLYGAEDYEQVIDALRPSLPAQGSTVLVGHGTYTPITAAYAMMDYMLKSKGYANAHVGTIEGYPTFDNVLQMLKSGTEKQVTLLPFMFVAGEHAKNDIAEDWKKELEENGYTVTVLMKGLGENPDIQDLFIERIKFATTHKLLPINEKKKEYAKGKDKF